MTPNDAHGPGALVSLLARLLLACALGWAGVALAAAPRERIEIKIDGVPDLSLIHISEPTRPY